ncbi:hypothetical protein GCM10022243_09500 [Saccharothrix violaceirubra]|uniref:MFS family permease n=1 Tax=Saccharothrix violaceirubra TaxID=413306 RepID=A0A7W7WWP9_9PSEU|nr:hypothetical protein [Saccharothrix violaceirubra]MBB4966212.1 MFS family permease [Saccharothrix violaceirubra]
MISAALVATAGPGPAFAPVARATGFSTVVGLAAAPLGMALAGPAAERVGPDAVLLVGAVVAVLSAPLALAVRSVRHLR